jgi:hypothetical protein
MNAHEVHVMNLSKTAKQHLADMVTILIRSMRVFFKQSTYFNLTEAEYGENGRHEHALLQEAEHAQATGGMPLWCILAIPILLALVAIPLLDLMR